MHNSMREIVSRIIEKIKIEEEDTILLDSSDSVSFEIKKENFSDITNIESDKKISWILSIEPP